MIKHNKHTNIVNPLTTFVYCNNNLISTTNTHGGQVIYNKLNLNMKSKISY